MVGRRKSEGKTNALESQGILTVRSDGAVHEELGGP
jgi:hypothetical protein